MDRKRGTSNIDWTSVIVGTTTTLTLVATIANLLERIFPEWNKLFNRLDDPSPYIASLIGGLLGVVISFSSSLYASKKKERKR